MVPITILVNFIVLERSRMSGTRDHSIAVPEAGVSERRSLGAVPATDNRHETAAPVSSPRFLTALQPAPRERRRPRRRRPCCPILRPAAAPAGHRPDLHRRRSLQAHTRAGSFLMRFAAVTELATAGCRCTAPTVAKRCMKRVRRDGRTILRLVTGEELPVSRTYLSAARAVCHEVDLDSPAALPRLPVHASAPAETAAAPLAIRYSTISWLIAEFSLTTPDRPHATRRTWAPPSTDQAAR